MIHNTILYKWQHLGLKPFLARICQNVFLLVINRDIIKEILICYLSVIDAIKKRKYKLSLCLDAKVNSTKLIGKDAINASQYITFFIGNWAFTFLSRFLEL